MNSEAFFKNKLISLEYFDPVNIHFRNEIISDFRGDLNEISAKTASLGMSLMMANQYTSFHPERSQVSILRTGFFLLGLFSMHCF